MLDLCGLGSGSRLGDMVIRNRGMRRRLGRGGGLDSLVDRGFLLFLSSFSLFAFLLVRSLFAFLLIRRECLLHFYENDVFSIFVLIVFDYHCNIVNINIIKIFQIFFHLWN